MNITLIGSSHGVAEPHRKCACNLITIGSKRYFIDMGTDTMEYMTDHGIDPCCVQGVFFTHMHGDHTDGLVPFVDKISWVKRFENCDPAIVLPDLGAVEILENWKRCCGSKVRALRYSQTQPGVIFDDGTLKVTAIPTQHCQRSFAMLVEAQGKCVLFSGDLKNPGVDFPDLTGRTVDLAICESAHFPTTDYIPVFAKYDIRRVVINHYQGHRIPSILELAATPGVPPVTVAHDDLEVVL